MKIIFLKDSICVFENNHYKKRKYYFNAAYNAIFMYSSKESQVPSITTFSPSSVPLAAFFFFFL